ncbi:zinc finger protein 438-like [Gadus chalcogrammus]|uniref:zinc finger protein 438-like n=1 Tax=Gadus chalcogrammus TaxID=1042646 RepID=UPI0024C4CEC9|nr:zinc finger protein 438-like [Gadus chalcogrammus]
MKSLQFRNIAPKAPAAVVSCPPQALRPCPPPSAVPDAATSPKSIMVPGQNYALMQIAGQDGTFSLVALPPSVSPQTPHPQQQQTPPVQNNPKLPIPRYPPMRSKGASEKTKPPPPPPPPPPSPTAKTLPKVAMATRARSTDAPPPVVKRKLLESKDFREPPPPPPPPHKELSEQVILIDPTASEISVSPLLPENAVLFPGPPLEHAADVPPQRPPPPAAAAVADVVHGLLYPPAPPAIVSQTKAPEEVKKEPRPCQPRPPAAASIAVLSPAIFSKAVQIIPSPPKGKLPIAPYSKMKSALVPAAKLSAASPETKALCGQLGLSSTSETAAQTSFKTEPLVVSPLPTPLIGAQPRTPFLPILGAPHKAPGKKRGRKRKTTEDVLTFEARRKRSLSFFRRRVPEKPPAGAAASPPSEVDITKKYRSIRPKPMLVMETVPQLLSLPPPAVTSDCLEQDLLRGNPLPGHTPSTPNGRPPPPPPPPPAPLALQLKGGAPHQRMFMGGRPLHRCPTCSRCFQFKHHLQSHMNSHTNSRPYVCPFCRKAYAHSGSLSTHTKLHHSDCWPLKTLRCEFCDKAFGYVGVYFSHLREVHKVVLTVEPSISHHEDDVAVAGAASLDQSEEPVDPVELQIKCGRCQATTPTFAAMKLHLLQVHREETPPRARDSRGGREAENELLALTLR